ncbi:MAG: HAMP domain-containing histidine kinase, partial [Epsilonproteobacteria bacterium]|nr:HAMP domain-containing histidine kinase [Campylobacterota bacterium]
RPLGVSVNKLIDRIQTFIKYQKELFIGVAHELKTPLAVMKTKNEVTMLRKREPEKYKEVLKLNNQTIDEMNKMISNILEIGRQEGAQFEEPVEMDIIEFLKERANNFKMLARGEGKDIVTDLKPEKYCLLIQKTLLIHILQNFVQNAIKFTPEGKKVTIKSYPKNEGLMIEVIDEGIGIDESKDLFAPFKRFGNKSGAGLGLFLAKSAADAIGAKIDIKNRTDGVSGAVASLFIPVKSRCSINGTKD